MKPNILLIVLDTQRADRLSCYGSPAGSEQPLTTPNLDRFAQGSTLFERAIAPAQWTIPSHASMFTGEYPSAHRTVQADVELGSEFPTLAELLKVKGYNTVGFCNNPLVGILKNGLRRGFDTFYSYGSALPTRPAAGTPWPQPLAWLVEQYTQFWRKLSYPIQNAFTKSDRLFQLALHPWLVPFWTRVLPFKGNTAESLRDVSRFVQQMAEQQSSPQTAEPKPFFCFVNLMEPHLPYWPPETFIQKFAPYFQHNRAARDFLRQYNNQPYRWMAPLPDPLDPLESQVLSDIYNAEVAYQDHLLGQLFETLTRSGLDDNTMVVVVADHGEGLGEHQYVGHAFVVYEELVRVPLIIRYPQAFPAGERIPTPVSTRRLFHTILDITGASTRRQITRLSLTRTLKGEDPEQQTVLSEAFPPHILIRAMEKRSDQLLTDFDCHATRRALYQGQTKLVQTGEVASLFDLAQDPQELNNLVAQDPSPISYLQSLLERLVAQAESRAPKQKTGSKIELESDADLLRRMQELGYLD